MRTLNENMKTVSEIAKLRKITVSAVHKAIKENRVDYQRIGFIYLVELNNKVYNLGK